jgi:hypothetical protein
MATLSAGGSAKHREALARMQAVVRKVLVEYAERMLMARYFS